MVVAVLLANGREAMVRRAINSFHKQTYENKRLLVFDTGDDSIGYLGDYDNVSHHWADLSLQSWSIGRLRNEANARALGDADLICHWDSDDWSHPRRIEEQVALLQASGKQCVGYRELLFWDTRFKDDGNPYGNQEAWVLSLPDQRSMVGASMMYTVDAWRAHPFCDGPRPGADGKLTDYEDNHWLMRNSSQTLGVSALDPTRLERFQSGDQIGVDNKPRMICGIHGDRQSGSYDPATMAKAKDWERAPEWDACCRRIMAL